MYCGKVVVGPDTAGRDCDLPVRRWVIGDKNDVGTEMGFYFLASTIGFSPMIESKWNNGVWRRQIDNPELIFDNIGTTLFREDVVVDIHVNDVKYSNNFAVKGLYLAARSHMSPTAGIDGVYSVQTPYTVWSQAAATGCLDYRDDIRSNTIWYSTQCYHQSQQCWKVGSSDAYECDTRGEMCEVDAIFYPDPATTVTMYIGGPPTAGDFVWAVRDEDGWLPLNSSAVQLEAITALQKDRAVDSCTTTIDHVLNEETIHGGGIAGAIISSVLLIVVAVLMAIRNHRTRKARKALEAEAVVDEYTSVVIQRSWALFVREYRHLTESGWFRKDAITPSTLGRLHIASTRVSKSREVGANLWSALLRPDITQANTLRARRRGSADGNGKIGVNLSLAPSSDLDGCIKLLTEAHLMMALEHPNIVRTCLSQIIRGRSVRTQRLRRPII